MYSPADLAKLYDYDVWRVWTPPSPARVAARMERRFMARAPRAMDAPDRDTFLWRYLSLACRKLGVKFRAQYQQRGTCVGQGGKNAGDVLMAINHFAYGLPLIGRNAVAGTYTGSRVESAGRPGRWDGSNGDWLAEWVEGIGGLLLLKDLGLAEDDRRNDERLAVQWTNSRQGIPAQYERMAKLRPVTDCSLCLDVREAAKGIQSGSPLVMCSNLIATGRRDRHGFSELRRSGGHCQVNIGVRYDPLGFYQWNSWDDRWGSGPLWPYDMPLGGVWITGDEMQAQLRQRDSFLWHGVTGPEGELALPL